MSASRLDDPAGDAHDGHVRIELRAFAISAGLVLGSACHGGSPAARTASPPGVASVPPARHPPGATAQTLARLRSKLDTVRNAAPEEGADVDVDDVDIKVLVGLSKEAIRTALGTPHCSNDEPPAPCERFSFWTYRFYELARSPDIITIGGGTDLHLHFDKHGICTSADWMRTQ